MPRYVERELRAYLACGIHAAAAAAAPPVLPRREQPFVRRILTPLAVKAALAETR
jgi:hypothetical protein